MAHPHGMPTWHANTVTKDEWLILPITWSLGSEIKTKSASLRKKFKKNFLSIGYLN
jgi:hypothetical protein